MVAAPCGGCERINSELMGKRPLRTHAHGAVRLADNTPRHFINLVQCTEPTKERKGDRWKKKVGQNILKFRLDLACSCSCCWICLFFLFFFFFCSFPNTGNLRFVLICRFSTRLGPSAIPTSALSYRPKQNFCIFSFSENVQRDLFSCLPLVLVLSLVLVLVLVLLLFLFLVLVLLPDMISGLAIPQICVHVYVCGVL